MNCDFFVHGSDCCSQFSSAWSQCILSDWKVIFNWVNYWKNTVLLHS